MRKIYSADIALLSVGQPANLCQYANLILEADSYKAALLKLAEHIPADTDILEINLGYAGEVV